MDAEVEPRSDLDIRQAERGHLEYFELTRRERRQRWAGVDLW